MGSPALLDQLYQIGVFRFGKFTLKCGSVTPIYADIRRVISFPDVMRALEEEMWKMIKRKRLAYDVICGVPYGAVPLCAALSLSRDIPMVFIRKDAKSHGTKQLIEGVYEKGGTCLLVEDVITHGTSIIDTTVLLRSQNLKVTDAIVVLDRCQGANSRIREDHVEAHSLYRLTDVVKYYLTNQKISKANYDEVISYLGTTVEEASHSISNNDDSATSWVEANDFHMKLRHDNLGHPIAKRLWEIALRKNSNICLACDMLDGQRILNLLETVGDHICVAKLHADIVNEFSPTLGAQLRRLADKKNFLIMEDRKLSDIGNVVQMQLTCGVHRPFEWADLVTVHPIAGPDMMESIRQLMSVGGQRPVGILIVMEMSSKDNLINDAYKRAALHMGRQFKDVVAGFVCQKRSIGDESFLYFTPGVHAASTMDAQGQCYRSMKAAIREDGNDIAIVGRGIINSENILKTAKEYKEEGWKTLTSTDA